MPQSSHSLEAEFVNGSKFSLPKHRIVGSAASKVSKAFGDMLALVLSRQQDTVTKVTKLSMTVLCICHQASKNAQESKALCSVMLQPLFQVLATCNGSSTQTGLRQGLFQNLLVASLHLGEPVSYTNKTKP